MDIPTELIDRITVSEGVRLVAYRDSLGNETIGIGHLLSSPITIGAADHILGDDIAKAKAQLDTALPWAERLDGVRYWTLVELAFNMGMGVAGGSHGLLSFEHTLVAIHDGRYANAAESLLQSKWAQEVQEGRAERIASQIRNGDWA